MTPLGTIARGLAAGAVGSLAMNLFFAASGPIMPGPVPDAFEPTDPQQGSENPLETTARRIVEGFLRRGPISPAQKAVLGNLVHYAFGAGWGALYARAHDAYPPLASPAGVAAFSTLVWNGGDNVLLPFLDLSGPPTAYPIRNHLYAVAAHLVYGSATAAADELLARSKASRAVVAGLAALGLGWSALRYVGSSEAPPSRARVPRRRQPARA